MTPQQIDAMKLALGALNDLAAWNDGEVGGHMDEPYAAGTSRKAITAIKEVLAEHAMRETQRLGQEIEQKIGCVNHDCDQCKAQPEQEPVAWVSEDVCKGQYIDGRPRKIWWECEKGVGTAFYTTPPQRTEQEPVAWPCLIDSADFSENTITLVMQCEDYKVTAGTHWLSTTPPRRKPLTNGEIYTAYITATNQTLRATDERLAFAFARAIEAEHGIKE
jgi:hypothetical protein